MTRPARQTDDEAARPLLFGGLEGLCFFCLFLSPLLAPSEPWRVWLGVALLRTVVLMSASLAELFPLLRASTYQIPFWVSALFFPLQPDQFEHATRGLLLQAALFGLLLMSARFAPGLRVEVAIYALSLGWVLCWRPPGLWLIPAVAGLVLPALWFRDQRWSLSSWQSLAVGSAWLAVFALPLPGTSEALVLMWALLLYLGCAISALQEDFSSRRESEWSLPSLGSARVWLTGRRSLSAAVGWAALPALVVSNAQEALGWLLIMPAWWRAVELSAGAWFNSDRLAWWAALEMTIIWIALQPTLAAAAFACALSGLVSLWAHRNRRSLALSPASLWDDFGCLEAQLLSGLRYPSPDGFAQRVMEQMATVELDRGLAAPAPMGFRERLLQRLRQSEDSDPEE
jgi:hypothetical protein